MQNQKVERKEQKKKERNEFVDYGLWTIDYGRYRMKKPGATSQEGDKRPPARWFPDTINADQGCFKFEIKKVISLLLFHYEKELSS